MKTQRRVLVAVLSLAASAGGALLPAGTAHAQQVTTGSLTFRGDKDDAIVHGKTYSYSTSKGDSIDVFSGNRAAVKIELRAANGDLWSVSFDAPGQPDRPAAGHPTELVPGTYTQAHRVPYNGMGPGLNVDGLRSGCNTLVGSFTIIKAVFGPNDYVQTLVAWLVIAVAGLLGVGVVMRVRGRRMRRPIGTPVVDPGGTV